MDLGQIFETLFVDRSFIEKLKARVNASKNSEYEGKCNYTKTEILEYLDNADENSLWDRIFESYDVPTLKIKFRYIQSYRNDVMHAHNINKEDFGKIKYLFNKVNNELDKAIGERIKLAENNKRNNIDINEAISNAIQTFNIIRETISPAYNELINRVEAFRNNLVHSPGYVNYMKIINSPEHLEYLEKMRQIVSVTQQPEFRAFSELSRKLAEISRPFEAAYYLGMPTDFQGYGNTDIGDAKQNNTDKDSKDTENKSDDTARKNKDKK